jgi:CubicO group peptidase (beta-lactamase class C family)
VALVWRDRAPAFGYAGGLAHRGHRVAMTETTRFAVASVTKMVTATTALRLVERGVVRLDQPLVEILVPAEQQPPALTRDHTLHHLLSHTSGLRNYHDDEDQTWDSFTSCWDRIPTYHLRRPADMLPLFKELPAVRAPGVA